MSPSAIVCHQPVQMVCTYPCTQYNRSAQDGNIFGHIRELFQLNMHRRTDFDNIPVFPFAVNAYIRRWFRPNCILFSVTQHLHFRSLDPPRMAYQHLEMSGLVHRNRKLASLFCRETCFLTQADAFFFPVQFRSYKQIDKQ